MLINLLFGFSTMIICLFFQIFLLIITITYYVKHRLNDNKASIWAHMFIFSVVMIMLLIGILGQISVWALLFLYLGELDQFKIAFYHSAVNFSSLGYGDIVLSEKHRLLGALEAINGVLMIGIATAALSAPIKHLLKTKLGQQKAQ